MKSTVSPTLRDPFATPCSSPTAVSSRAQVSMLLGQQIYQHSTTRHLCANNQARKHATPAGSRCCHLSTKHQKLQHGAITVCKISPDDKRLEHVEPIQGGNEPVLSSLIVNDGLHQGEAPLCGAHALLHDTVCCTCKHWESLICTPCNISCKTLGGKFKAPTFS